MNTCKNCGKELLSEKNKYCNLTCRNVYVNKHIRNYSKNSETNKKRFRDRYYKNPKKCKWCDKIIEYENRSKNLCSDNCRKNLIVFNNKKRKGKKVNFSEKSINNIRTATFNRLKPLIDNYNNKPKYCKECGKKIPYLIRNHVFCNIGCKRKYDRKHMSKYFIYYRNCQFDFNLSDYPNEFNFDLINEYGWYKPKNRGNNLSGISRDHMISIKYGFENDIDFNIIKHPANCQLMKHSDNISKHKKCSITIDELLNKIKIWDDKYLYNKCAHSVNG